MLHTAVEAVHVVPKVRVLNRWQNHANALAEERETAARLELEAALASIGTSVPIDLRIVTGHVAECVAQVVKTTPHRHPLLVIGRRAGATGATAYRILALA